MKQQLFEALRRLASERKLFHSEADFQFELAIMLKKLFPDLKIRVEKPFDSRRFSFKLNGSTFLICPIKMANLNIFFLKLKLNPITSLKTLAK